MDFKIKTNEVVLLTTFYIGDSYFGLPVMDVQEVTNTPKIVPVPLAPKFMKGLINLRGQLATALDLKELFMKTQNLNEDQMSVVCRIDGNLVSLMVDVIGDVVEAEKDHFEPAPSTMSQPLKSYIKGVYKMNGKLLSVIDIQRVAKELTPTEVSENRMSS